jgi:hypothetical protein
VTARLETLYRFLVVTSILVLLTAVSALVWQSRSQHVANAEARKQLQQLTSNVERLERRRTGSSLELQAKCQAQAASVFNEWGHGTRRYFRGGDRGTFLADYINHYNPALEKCFVIIRVMDQKTSPWEDSKDLLDAFEGNSYGIQGDE